MQYGKKLLASVPNELVSVPEDGFGDSSDGDEETIAEELTTLLPSY